MEEKYFLVDVLEHHSRRVKVKAKDFDEAVEKVDAAWREGKIELVCVDGEIPGGRESEENEDLSMYIEVEG